MRNVITYNTKDLNLVRIRQNIFLAIVIAFLLQLIIDFSLENIMSSLLASLVSLMTFLAVLRSDLIRQFPIVLLIVISPTISYAFGPLLFQTIEFTPIIFNLQSPLFTFFIVGYLQLAVFISFYIFVYSRFSVGLSEFLREKVWSPLSIFEPPKNSQLWIMGFIGVVSLVAKSASNIDGGLETGDTSAKFLDAFRIFTYAPFLIPVLSFFEQSSINQRTYSVKSLFVYFVFILVVSIGLNSRGAFAIGVANLIFLFTFLYLDGQINLTRRLKLIFASSLVTGVLLFPVVSDLATAMVMVREDRDDVSALEMINKTLDAFQDKESIERYRKLKDFIIGTHEYNEYYLNNPFLSRFVNIKFNDNVLSLTSIQEVNKSDEIMDYTVNKIIALAPQPIINLFTLDFNKDDYSYSFGDYAYYLENHTGLGGYKVGSAVGQLFGMFGYMFIFLLIPILLAFFVIVNSFNKYSKTGFIIAPVIMLVFISFYYKITNDSINEVFSYVLRGLPQSIILYFLLYKLTNISFLKSR